VSESGESTWIENLDDALDDSVDDACPDGIDSSPPLSRVQAEDEGHKCVSPKKRSYEQFHEFELTGGNTPRQRLSGLLKKTSGVKLHLRRSKTRAKLS